MINFEGKPLEQLSFQETIEFEKMMLKKVLSASRTGMSEEVVDQLNLFVDLIREHKRSFSYTPDSKKDGVVLTLGEWEEPDLEDDNNENE